MQPQERTHASEFGRTCTYMSNLRRDLICVRVLAFPRLCGRWDTRASVPPTDTSQGHVHPSLLQTRRRFIEAGADVCKVCVSTRTDLGRVHRRAAPPASRTRNHVCFVDPRCSATAATGTRTSTGQQPRHVNAWVFSAFPDTTPTRSQTKALFV